MDVREFTRALQASMWVQLRDAGVTGVTTRWPSREDEFQHVVNGITLTISCYETAAGDLSAVIDVVYPDGRQPKTYLLAPRKQDPAKDPRVVDALGGKYRYSMLVES
jgi:hypothetical protein